jgi:sugar lactone lactonase YvrE
LRRRRARLAALALVLLVGVAGASAAIVERERFRANFDKLARSLGFTGEDELAERFTRSTLAGSSSLRPTALQFGPDGRLYVAQQDGLIKAYTIARDGPRAYRVTATETISLVRGLPNHDDDGRPNPRVSGRQLTGMVVAGTSASPLLYVSSSDPRVGGSDDGEDTNLDTNSGVISRLTRVDGAWHRLDLVRGLPRSEEFHATNGLALSADGGTLYAAQGGNVNAGAPSHNFAQLPQYALAGAVLSVDLPAIGEETYDLPTLDDDTRAGSPDEGEPFGGNDGKNQARLVPGAPVDLYAIGFRNPYDLVLTESGRLLTVDNGMNEGWGGLPAGEGTDRCTNEVRELGGDAQDGLHLISRGYYAGNPNPTRGNRANVFNEDRQSPVPVANPLECDWREPGPENGALVTFGESTNGLAEYRSASLGGELRGELLTVSFDGSVHRIELAADGRSASSRVLFAAVTTVPLDVTATPDDGAFPGTIWVAGWVKGEIAVFEPEDYGLGRWEARSSSERRRQEVSFVAARGRLYLAGGGTAHQVYDPATDSWADVAPLPANVDHIQGVELGGRVYYVGGLRSWPEPAVGTVLAYDPATDRFERRTPMPRPRGAGGVAAYRGKIYYAGGLNEGRAVPWVDAYDTETGTWERLPDMPRARDHFQAAVVGDKLYAIGGRDVDIDETTPAVDVFDLERNEWRQGLAPLPTPRGGFAVAVAGEEILVIGGEGGGKSFDTVESYNTRTDSWRELAPMHVARHGISAAVCGGVYVAAGGREQGGGEPTDVQEVFLPGADPLPCP